jgi:hypothetical protein
MRTVDVSKCLDKKLTLFGFEVADVLAVFVWLPSAALALVLRYGKQGKPDKYLVHWLRFQIKPGRLSAFEPPSVWEAPPKRKQVS